MKIYIIKTKKIVEKYLFGYPHLRDNDERLIATIWNEELSNKGITSKEISGYDFLGYFASGELTNPESIRRTRQKLQEENVELRGLKYKERKANTKNIKGQLK
jgi:hypothetical protein